MIRRSKFGDQSSYPFDDIKPNKSEYDTLTTQGNAIPVYLDLTADARHR